MTPDPITPRLVIGTNLYWFNHENGWHSLVRQTQAKETVILILDDDEYKAMQQYFTKGQSK
jgi:hypothetical protein